MQIKKYIVLGLSVLAFGLSHAHAMETSEKSEVRWELIKCTSPHNGTLWASFGHLIRSGSDEIVYFPVEIVLFSEALNVRIQPASLDEALKNSVRTHKGFFAMEFKASDGVRTQNIRISLLQYPELEHSYLGDWEVKEDGKPDIHDPAACSLH